ncbi:Cyclin-dependent kinase E-1 [Glycine soja]
MGDGSGSRWSRAEWVQQYDLLGKIGEGTYGLVFLARTKSPVGTPSKSIAIKKFKQSKDGDGVSPTAIREIMLLREITHENVVKLVNVHINHADMSLYLAFDYAEHDLYEIIRHHRDKLNHSINQYTVKSLLWQLLNGLSYLHSNWMIHRDLKPSNILVMGEGEEHGVVKIADFGLARIYQAPLKPLSDNGVVVTIWYRAPELLLGAKHYTSAVDMWAMGCIFAELLTLKPLFQGAEVKATSNPFQLDQLDKIFKVLGHCYCARPSHIRKVAFLSKSSALATRCATYTRTQIVRSFDTIVGDAANFHYLCDYTIICRDHLFLYDNAGLYNVVHLSPKSPAYDLLSKMLEYDPRKRLTAAQALEHDSVFVAQLLSDKHPYALFARYFKIEPLPGRNALVPCQLGEKIVNYPTRPVDTTTDLEGTTNLPPSQTVNAVSGSMPGPHGSNRSVPRPMNVVGMQRLPPQAMAAYNLSSQAAMGDGMNPGDISKHRVEKEGANGDAGIPCTTEVKTIIRFLLEERLSEDRFGVNTSVPELMQDISGQGLPSILASLTLLQSKIGCILLWNFDAKMPNNILPHMIEDSSNITCLWYFRFEFFCDHWNHRLFTPKEIIEAFCE